MKIALARHHLDIARSNLDDFDSTDRVGRNLATLARVLVDVGEAVVAGLEALAQPETDVIPVEADEWSICRHCSTAVWRRADRPWTHTMASRNDHEAEPGGE